jgi:secernin
MCDTMVHVLGDRVLFAKNSDRDPNEAQVLEWVPARDHAPGDVKCTWIAVPQVAHTHAVLLSRPYWMFGAEMGANEHGVVIGNEAVFTRQPYAKEGLTGMDLLRLALERARTAEEAVQTLISLLEEHGQGGGCGHEDRGFTYHNSFLVADRRGAVVLETAGRFWATEAVKHGARSISNGLTIPRFAEEHSDWLKTRVSACKLRQPRTTALAAASSSPADLMRALRDHGGDGPAYGWVNGAMAAPCMHGGGLLAASQTTGSWVSELGEAARHWATGTAAPCTGLFKPVAVDEPVDVGAPTDVPDGSLWWRHERLHRRVMKDPITAFPRFTPDRDRLEASFLADRPSSQEAFAAGDAALERWISAVGSVEDVRPWYVRNYWRRRGTADRPTPAG